MSHTLIPAYVTGHVHAAYADNGEVVVDQYNAVHPQNMAHIFARALAGEANSSIYRMAFGNGGTTVDAALQVSFKTPNDGQPPDTATWDSRIYHETYSEICYNPLTLPNPLVGTDPGSADANTGLRSGGGAVPSSDATPNSVRSNETGLISQAVIQVTINGDEPLTQAENDSEPSVQTDFTFDEIGLYTSGAQALPTAGYQQVDVGDRVSTDNSGLVPGVTYSFNLAVDGGQSQIITFTCPSVGGSGASNEILYGDLCEALNTGDPSWAISPAAPIATVLITDLTGGTFPSITGAQTFGYLRFDSPTSGVTSAVSLAGANTNAFLNALNPPVGGTLLVPIPGARAGVQNDPSNPENERERLLTHIIFTPVNKAANRTLVVTYTLSISVARTPH